MEWTGKIVSPHSRTCSSRGWVITRQWVCGKCFSFGWEMKLDHKRPKVSSISKSIWFHGDTDIGERLVDMGLGGKEKVGWMERISWKHINYHMENRKPVGICCMTQGAQTCSLWHPRGVGWDGRWEGHSRGREHRYAYSLFMLKYSRK